MNEAISIKPEAASTGLEQGQTRGPKAAIATGTRVVHPGHVAIGASHAGPGHVQSCDR